jgi:hypothetical protein
MRSLVTHSLNHLRPTSAGRNQSPIAVCVGQLARAVISPPPSSPLAPQYDGHFTLAVLSSEIIASNTDRHITHTAFICLYVRLFFVAFHCKIHGHNLIQNACGLEFTSGRNI